MSRPLGSRSQATSAPVYPERVNNYQIVNDDWTDPAAEDWLERQVAAEAAEAADPELTWDESRAAVVAHYLASGPVVAAAVPVAAAGPAVAAANQNDRNPLAAIVAKADAKTRKRLRRQSAKLTDSDDLIDLLNAAEERADNAAKAAYQDAIADISARQAERAADLAAAEAATPTLDRADQLPEHIAAALLHEAGLSPVSVLRQTITSGLSAQSPVYEQIADLARLMNKLQPKGTKRPGKITLYSRGEKDITLHGQALSRGLPNEIRTAAESLAEGWKQIYQSRPTLRASTPGYIIAERTCPRWNRLQLKREAKRAAVWYDISMAAARPGCKFVSNSVLNSYIAQQEMGAEWARNTVITFQKSDGTYEAVPMTDIQQRQKRAKCAQMYSIVRTMEYIGDERGHTCFFGSLTLPTEYHPYSFGAPGPDGTYPNAHRNANWNGLGARACREELNHRLKLLRANLAKHKELRDYWGIVVPEPHGDGTPHMHFMIWLPPTYGAGACTTDLLNSILKAIAPGARERDLKVIDRDAVLPDGKRAASPAGYVMTYVIKSLSDDDTEALTTTIEGMPGPTATDQKQKNDEKNRYRAWKNSREIRGLRLLGVHGSLKVLQRLWPKFDQDGEPVKETEVLPPRFARTRSALLAAQQNTTAMQAFQAEVKRLNAEIAEIQKRTTTTAEDRTTAVAMAANAAIASAKADETRIAANKAMATALGIVGAIKCLTEPDGGALKLTYEEAETMYGRPSRKAEGIIDTLTNDWIALKTTETEMMSVGDWEKQKAHANTLKAMEVTVAATYPRPDGSPPFVPADDVNVSATIDGISHLCGLLAERQDWEVDHPHIQWLRAQITKLKLDVYGPPPPPTPPPPTPKRASALSYIDEYQEAA